LSSWPYVPAGGLTRILSSLDLNSAMFLVLVAASRGYPTSPTIQLAISSVLPSFRFVKRFETILRAWPTASPQASLLSIVLIPAASGNIVRPARKRTAPSRFIYPPRDRRALFGSRLPRKVVEILAQRPFPYLEI